MSKMKVIERLAGRYEVQAMEFGRAYRWRPESIVIECECGERTILKGKDLVGRVLVCECGIDHTVDVQEAVALHRPQDVEDDEALHPWRYWPTSADSGLPF